MSERPRLSISFCISDNYAQHLAVVVASMLANTPACDFRFHVLYSALREETVARLKAWAEASQGRFEFVFHQVDRRHFDAFPLPLEHITQEMYYRYLLPELLTDEARTIYIDVDVLALGDLLPLWQWDLGDCPLAGTTDLKEDTPEFRAYKQRLGMRPDAKYFLSGMLVMNLETLRREGFGRKCMENTAKHFDHIAWPDQDVINLTMEGRILELPMRFNCVDPKYLPKGEQMVVRHFANFSSKPWCCLWKNRTWPGYVRYLRQTPYRDQTWRFLWAHLLGFFYFRYTKKGYERVLICGILIYKRKVIKGA